MTGSARYDRPFVAGSALVRGRWHHVSWFDLRSGEQLREEPVRGAYVRGDGDPITTRLLVVPHPQSHEPEWLSALVGHADRPGLKRVWTHGFGDLPFEPADAAVSGDLAVLTCEGPRSGVDLVGLDLRSGEVRWTRRSECWRAAVDARGVVAYGSHDLLCLGLAGEVRWRAVAYRPWSVLLCAHAVVVHEGDRPSRLRFHDRESGAVLAEQAWRGGPLSAARGFVYGFDHSRGAGDERLACLSPRGELVWSVDRRILLEGAFAWTVVPLRRRLYVITERDSGRRAEVVCLAGGSGARGASSDTRHGAR